MGVKSISEQKLKTFYTLLDGKSVLKRRQNKKKQAIKANGGQHMEI